MLKVKIFTIFPESFPSVLGVSVCRRAMEEKKWELKIIDVKNFAEDKHKTVDDYPFGGGAGMLLKPDILSKAVESELQSEIEKPLIIVTSARGVTFEQKIAHKMQASYSTIYFICGRFEGVDERFIELYNAIEMNIGKFVLFGGEVATMAMIETIVRLIPDVLGNEETKMEESYSVGTEFENLMEYPQYTKPREWKGMEVPEILLSGHHQKIKNWRLEKAKEVTEKFKNFKF